MSITTKAIGVVVAFCACAWSAASFQSAAQEGGIPDAFAGQFANLTNPKATPEARGLMRYLSAIYGSHVLSGHQMSYTVSTGEKELAQIKTWTGEAPATRGFDFMDVINGWGAPHARLALEWAQAEGGIVQLCWHWRLDGSDFRSSTSFPSGDPETDTKINADLKKLGDELQKFADAKIPVLWRPIHEPPGKWFWWHNAGADKYKRLWIHMYKYLVETRKLNNLIWVYSSSDGGYTNSSWYPGNEYVDIIGVDGYGANWQPYWDGLWTMCDKGKRMQAMTENKKFPPWNNKNPWLWTLGWNDEIFNELGEADFKGHYNHSNTINMDDLPTAKNPANGKPRATWDQMLVHVPLSSSSITTSSSSSLLVSSSSKPLSSSVRSSSSAQASSSSTTVGVLENRIMSVPKGVFGHWDLLGRGK